MSGAKTHIADVRPCPGVVRFPPVDEASKSLNDLNRLPILSESTDGEFVGKFLAGPIHFRLEKFRTGHEESGEQKGTP